MNKIKTDLTDLWSQPITLDGRQLRLEPLASKHQSHFKLVFG